MKLVIGITGASGSIYAKALIDKLTILKEQISECGVVMSDTARTVWEYELDNKDYNNISFKTYDNKNFFAPFASGSAGFDTMIICPCSTGTLGRIAAGTSDNLLIRAAEVMLKERKKLILVTREMPLNIIHINNMKTVTEAGGIICPASPSFYSKPESVDKIINTVIEKVLNIAGFKFSKYEWGHNNEQ